MTVLPQYHPQVLLKYFEAKAVLESNQELKNLIPELDQVRDRDPAPESLP